MLVHVGTAVPPNVERRGEERREDCRCEMLLSEVKETFQK